MSDEDDYMINNPENFERAISEIYACLERMPLNKHDSVLFVMRALLNVEPQLKENGKICSELIGLMAAAMAVERKFGAPSGGKDDPFKYLTK